MNTQPSYKFCARCRAQHHENAQYCANCGQPFPNPYANPPGPQQYPYGAANPNWQASGVPDQNRLLITLLLWFFLGHFGAHRFYLGYNGAGAGMLTLTIVGVLTACILIGYFLLLAVFIWWIVDLIQILTGSLRPVDGGRLV